MSSADIRLPVHFQFRLQNVHDKTQTDLFFQIKGGDFDEKYVLSSRVRTGRSIRGYGLPPWCTRAERRAIEKICVEALAGLSGPLKGKYYPLAKMTEAEQEKLIEVRKQTSLLCTEHQCTHSMSSEQMFAFLDKNVRRLVNNNSCGNAQSKIEQHCAKMLSVIACCETKRNDNQPVPCGTV